MSGQPFGRAVLAAALAYVIEPAPQPTGGPEPVAMVRRPLVAVAGLAEGCGTTTVARGLAAAMAERDACGAAAVVGVEVPATSVGVLPLGSRRARRLARELRPLVSSRLSAAGRLCLLPGAELQRVADAVRWIAPAVIEVPAGEPAGPAAAAADAVILVAGQGIEPALACAAAASLARIGPEPLVVLGRGSGAGERWEDRAHAVLPDSRAGARLAAAGVSSPGALGVAFEALAAEVGP